MIFQMICLDNQFYLNFLKDFLNCKTFKSFKIYIAYTTSQKFLNSKIFNASLLQSSLSHSEIILICSFAIQETYFINIIIDI